MIRRALLLTGYLLFIAALWAGFVNLPERVASHFSLNGLADGYGSKDTFILIMTVVGLIPAFLVALGSFVPLSMLNVPNREYWAAPERAAETRQHVKEYLVSLAIIFILLEAGVILSILEANHVQPARLDVAVFGPMLFFTFAGVIYQVVSMHRRFSQTS